MKYASIILVTYSQVDDFGGKRARNEKKTRPEMLRITLDSLFKNTDYPAEIIVIDNGGNPDDSNYLLDLAREGKINMYVRNKNNMQYAFSHNLGAKMATGDYLVLTCNDVGFKYKWLSTCVNLLEHYKNRKFIATPLFCSHWDKKYDWGELDGNRLNPLAGSNCMVMTKETFKELGDLNVDGTYSNKWFIQKIKKGYIMIAPPEDLAEHLSPTGGLNWRQKVEIKKVLLKGQKIDFDEHNKQEEYDEHNG